MSTNRQNLGQTLGAIALGVAALIGIGVLQHPQLQALNDRELRTEAEMRQENTATANQLTVLQRSPAFGYDNLMADWAFLSFIQYFGDEDARQKTGFALSPEFFEVIVQRDPFFMDPYFFLSTSASIYAGLPERSVALMDKGLSQMTPTMPPDSFYLWRQKAIDEVLFLGEPERAEQSFRTTAEWARESGAPGSAEVAAMSEQTADFLANDPDSTNAQIGAWLIVLSSSPDARVRQTALLRIESLGGEIIYSEGGRVSVQLPQDIN
jgi:hypothetical protein